MEFKREREALHPYIPHLHLFKISLEAITKMSRTTLNLSSITTKAPPRSGVSLEN
jgi:hypothetical protein